MEAGKYEGDRINYSYNKTVLWKVGETLHMLFCHHFWCFFTVLCCTSESGSSPTIQPHSQCSHLILCLGFWELSLTELCVSLHLLPNLTLTATCVSSEIYIFQTDRRQGTSFFSLVFYILFYRIREVADPR